MTITRKNSLFAGSEGGGRTWATLATLLQTAKTNNVDPLDWLSQTLTRIAKGWPASEIDASCRGTSRPTASANRLRCRRGEVLLFGGDDTVEIGDDGAKHTEAPKVVLAWYRSWNASHQENGVHPI